METSGRAAARSSRERIAALVEAPDFSVPLLDRFYDDAEAALVEALGEAERLAAAPTADGIPTTDLPAGTSVADVLARFPDLTLDDLRRAHRRAVVNLSADETTVSVASFRERFEPWITFEGWKDLPVDVRVQLAEWDHDAYVDEVRDDVTDLVDGRAPKDRTGNDSFVLLREAEAIVGAAGRLFVRPCSCRRIHDHDGCGKPVDVCIWIDEDDRGAGWEISRERALEILHDADDAGLMFTANTPEAAKATWICCCCSDCCAPILAAEKLGVSHAWPLRRYVASVDDDTCSRCGTCVERCPFDAWTLDAVGGATSPRLSAADCRGCGVCETGCPEGAITMAPTS